MGHFPPVPMVLLDIQKKLQRQWSENIEYSMLGLADWIETVIKEEITDLSRNCLPWMMSVLFYFRWCIHRHSENWYLLSPETHFIKFNTHQGHHHNCLCYVGNKPLPGWIYIYGYFNIVEIRRIAFTHIPAICCINSFLLWCGDQHMSEGSNSIKRWQYCHSVGFRWNTATQLYHAVTVHSLCGFMAELAAMML